MGYPQLAAGDLAQAEHEFASAADAFRSLGDRWGTSLALDSLAGLAGLYGDPSKAIALIDEALALTEQLGAVEDLPDLLCNRGDHRVRTALAGRDGPDAAGTGLAEARADYERAAEIARHAGSPTYLAGGAARPRRHRAVGGRPGRGAGCTSRRWNGSRRTG